MLIFFPHRESEVNQKDILSAVGYSLKREIPKKNLNRDDITALQHWVILLSQVFIFFQFSVLVLLVFLLPTSLFDGV